MILSSKLIRASATSRLLDIFLSPSIMTSSSS
jgi:hypothetical protein